MKTPKVSSLAPLGFLPGTLVDALTLTLITLLAAGPAMAGKSKDVHSTYSATYMLVPTLDSPEPTASGKVTEERGYSVYTLPGERIAIGWTVNSVNCRRLTPAKQYQIGCVVEFLSTYFGSVRQENRTFTVTTDKLGRLITQFGIHGEAYENAVSVICIWIEDDTGNVVLVSGS